MLKKISKIKFDKTSIRDIQHILDETKSELIRESKNSDSFYNNEAKFQFVRVANAIDRKDILDMSPQEIETYINSLVAIVEFNTGIF